MNEFGGFAVFNCRVFSHFNGEAHQPARARAQVASIREGDAVVFIETAVGC
jgi:hypothetical protein